jgi:hypothetical protein
MLLHTKFTWTDWMYVAAPFQIYLIIVVVLECYGEHSYESNILEIFFRRISNCLERWTGYAGWSMAGALSGLLMLGTAAIGLYWDVGFHVDYGRDQQLLTPSHTMIVLGLGGLIYSAVIAVIFASIDQADVDVRVGPIRIPWSAIALAAFGIGGVAAFPLDAQWHNAYGVDVTLWSPTHLQLVFGGSMATIVLWLMLREGRATQHPSRRTLPTLLGRGIEVTIFGAILTGVSTVQGEFDFGVPQFQVLYLPILIAVAAGLALVLARLALGRWGAVKTVLAFLIIRGLIAVLVGGPFNETVPHFPLYIVAALAIEGVAFLLGTEQRLRFAVVAGALAGTVGVAADLIWLNAIAEVHATNAVLPKAAVLAPIAAIAAAVLGAALARPVEGGSRIPSVAAVAAGVALLLVLAYPLPRNVGHVEADVKLTPVGDGDQATVEVDLQPADAAKSATAFGIVAWQGGGRISASLNEVAPGRYVSSKPVPITGRWKSVVGLQRQDEVMAVPVYLPADPEIGAPEVPAVPEKHETFVRNTKWLLREQHAGVAWAATAAYSGLAIMIAIWVGLYAACAIKITRAQEERAAEPQPSARVPWPSGPGRNGHSEPGPEPARPIVGATWGDPGAARGG